VLRNFTLYHRVFAHESAAGDSGLRIAPLGDRDAGKILPEATLHELDELLGSIMPEGDMPAIAVRRFEIPNAIGSIPCLVVCHPSHRDGIQRPASVTHARLVRIDSAETWLDIDAMIGLASEFPLTILQGSLDANLARYLEANETTVNMAGWDASRFLDVSPEFARDVAGMVLSRWSNRSQGCFHLEPRDSIELLTDLSAVWSVLPLQAQVACPFSLHAQKGARVKALFSTLTKESEPVPEKLKQWAADYVDWAHDRPDDVRYLTQDREIREVKTLDERFQALTAKAQASEGELRSQREEGSRKRKQQAPGQRSNKGGGLDEELVAAINRDVQAAEESLRDYVDKRLRSSRYPRTGDRSDEPWLVSLRGWQRWIPLVAGSAIAIAIVAALVYLGLQARAGDVRLAALEKRVAALEPAHEALSEASPTVVPSAVPAPERSQLIPATEVPGSGWAQRFQGLSDRDPRRLAAITDAIVTGSEQRAMPPETEARFSQIDGQLAAGAKLVRADRALLRTLLVQCITRRAVEGSEPAVNIDGKLAGTPKAALKRVKLMLVVASKTGDEEQTADFEAEVILRWAKEKGL
jgi:hypothetical protein